jgi:hypothetical protein
VLVTTPVWLVVACMTEPEMEETPSLFYRRDHPGPRLWRPVTEQDKDVIPDRDGIFNLID